MGLDKITSGLNIQLFKDECVNDAKKEIGVLLGGSRLYKIRWWNAIFLKLPKLFSDYFDKRIVEITNKSIKITKPSFNENALKINEIKSTAISSLIRSEQPDKRSKEEQVQDPNIQTAAVESNLQKKPILPPLEKTFPDFKIGEPNLNGRLFNLVQPYWKDQTLENLILILKEILKKTLENESLEAKDRTIINGLLSDGNKLKGILILELRNQFKANPKETLQTLSNDQKRFVSDLVLKYYKEQIEQKPETWKTLSTDIKVAILKDVWNKVQEEVVYRCKNEEAEKTTTDIYLDIIFETDSFHPTEEMRIESALRLAENSQTSSVDAYLKKLEEILEKLIGIELPSAKPNEEDPMAGARARLDLFIATGIPGKNIRVKEDSEQKTKINDALTQLEKIFGIKATLYIDKTLSEKDDEAICEYVNIQKTRDPNVDEGKVWDNAMTKIEAYRTKEGKELASAREALGLP